MRRTALLVLVLLAVGCGRDGGPEVRFAGSEVVPAGELAAAARRELDGWRAHRRRADLVDAADAMQARLHDAGLPWAEVEWRSEGEPARAVLFTVREGPRARLGTIAFPGATAFRADRLRPFFTGGSGFFGFGDPLYRRDAIDGAVGQVERQYLLHGWLRVRVGPVRTTWNAARDRADLAVPVVEGRRYVVERVEIALDGHPELDAGELRRVAAVQGGAFHERVGHEAAARLRAWLLARGYVRAEVVPESLVDDVAATATIRLGVRPGPLTTLRRVEVETRADGRRGRTSPRFVRFHLPLRPGDLARGDQLDDGVRYLHQTGLFGRIGTAWRTAVGDDRVQTADLVLTLEEVRARRLDLLAGWGSWEQARGGVTLADDNLFGHGLRGRAGARASLRGWGLDGTLAYDIGPRDSLALTGTRERRQEPSWLRDTTASDLSLRHQLEGPLWRQLVGGEGRVTLGYRYAATEASQIEGAIPTAEDGLLRTSTVYARLRRDSRDSVVDPRQGWLTELGTAWSTPALGAELDFAEYSALYARYDRLAERVVLAIGGRAVTRLILDERTTLPIQERLFLGGDRTVRSFDQDELGPTNPEGDPLGGLSTAVANVELRVRALKQLETAAFYDIGAVGSETWKLTLPPGHAIGGGLRYVLPVGPIRLDGAWNPGRRFAADRRWQVHLTVGFAF